MSDEDKIRRAQHAERILADELFKEALGKLRDHALSVFRDADAKDIESLRYARIYHDVAETFFSHFAEVLATGKLAKANADRKSDNPAIRRSNEVFP